MRTAFALNLAAVAGALHAQQGPVRIDSHDIGGVVTGAKGPEGSVWLIAATTDLTTKFAKIVVTNRHGQKAGPLREGLDTATGELVAVTGRTSSGRSSGSRFAMKSRFAPWLPASRRYTVKIPRSRLLAIRPMVAAGTPC